MKKSEWTKSICLAVLISVGIIQTIMLWLGAMPSQSFFHTSPSQEVGIEPTTIWFIKPSASNANTAASFAYKMDRTIETTENEYNQLVTKLQQILRSEGTNYKKIQTYDGINWEELLAKPALMYTYEVPLALNDLSGGTLEEDTIQHIDRIFLYSDSKFKQTLTVAFVSVQDQKVYMLDLEGDFEAFGKVYYFYTGEELLQGIPKYQPSALSNIRGYIKDNALMPIASSQSPIYYDVLMQHNPIDLTTEHGVKELERHVNSFFFNPLLKDTSYTEDGSIVFTEQTQSIVTYNPRGVIEYINLAIKKSNTTTTIGSGYNKAMAFIASTGAIPDVDKEKLYLANVQESGGIFTYAFDYLYDGHKVVLGEAMREKLGIQSVIEVNIKDNQVVGASICIVKFKPETVSGYIKRASLRTDYVDPINTLLEVLGEEAEGVVFDTVDTMYVIEDGETGSHLRRGVLHDGKWYYP